MHQFDDVEQQYEASSLGMWVFLLTEIMFFGGLFTGYTVYRVAYPAAFAEGSHHLDIVLGGINTAVLIGSSLDHGARCTQRAGRGTSGTHPLSAAHACCWGWYFWASRAWSMPISSRNIWCPAAAFVVEGPHAPQVQLFFRFLLRHDRHARPAYDHRPWDSSPCLPGRPGVATSRQRISRRSSSRGCTGILSISSGSFSFPCSTYSVATDASASRLAPALIIWYSSSSWGLPSSPSGLRFLDLGPLNTVIALTIAIS